MCDKFPLGVHQKVWGKIFLMYSVKKLSGSIGHLKMIRLIYKCTCPTLFDALQFGFDDRKPLIITIFTENYNYFHGINEMFLLRDLKSLDFYN